MPKSKWNLNTIYISERLQESLRPISRCAMTTVVAPMGYGKTTAVNWYLEERAKAETLKIIRISVYSDNLAIFWKSVQEAFACAGFDFLRDYTCPTDASGGGLLVDDLCHELAGDTSYYIFIDDFHLLTDRRVSTFLCMLANQLPANVHLIVASRDRFLAAAEAVRLGNRVYQIGTEQLRLNHTELAIYAHRCGTSLSDAQIEALLYSSEGWFSAVYLNLRALSDAAPDGFVMPFVENYDLLQPILAREIKSDLVVKIIELGEAANARKAENTRPVVFDALTDREYETVLLMGEHLTNREIAERLFLSEGSVKQYVNQIYSKLHIEGDTRTKRKKLAALLSQNT